MKTKSIAMLKPGKLVNDPMKYHPIALLSQMFKLFQELIYSRGNVPIDYADDLGLSTHLLDIIEATQKPSVQLPM